MKKLIDIRDEEVVKLKIEAAKQGKSFKKLIEERVLVDNLNKTIEEMFEKENSNLSELTKLFMQGGDKATVSYDYVLDCFGEATQNQDDSKIEFYFERLDFLFSLNEYAESMINILKDRIYTDFNAESQVEIYDLVKDSKSLNDFGMKFFIDKNGGLQYQLKHLEKSFKKGKIKEKLYNELVNYFKSLF